MKTALFDPNHYKFTNDIIRHFESLGEIKHTLYYDPEMVKWADTVWFETCDNNLAVATKGTINNETAETVGLKNKNVIVRIIDIEAWSGLHKNIDWQYVKHVIFIAEHIKRLVEKDIDFATYGTKVHLIPCGVNLDNFFYREKPNTKRIAWVAHRWHAKGIDLILQLALKLQRLDPEYKIYALGSQNIENWYQEYINYFMRYNDIENIEFIEHVDDMNGWLDDKDYAICASKKEAFSYAIAEGMAKGLKPLIHNFYGANEIWPKEYIWNTIDECLDMIISPIKSIEYRNYIEKYSTTNMLKKFDEEVLND